MSVATFGDLADMASRRLGTAAALADSGLPVEGVAEAARPMRRIALTLSRYLGDIAAYDEVEAITSTQLGAWIPSVVDAREALRLAADSLRPSAATAPAEAAGTITASLDTAAASLAAGRDLLRTHLFTGADGTPLNRSDWAAVVTSAPVTMAVLDKIADWSQELALLTNRLSIALTAEPARMLAHPVRQGLAGACCWLLIANASLRSGARGTSAMLPDTDLLMAIPARSVPARRPPQARETTTELCQGAVTSAIRLRAIACAADGKAAYGAVMTAESLRWQATGAAVTCHISENILRLLAGAADPASSGIETGLRGAAEAASNACAWWRQVTAAWGRITTETTGLTSAGIPDAGDVIVRLGRLAYANAEWTPRRARHAQLRDPADLAGEEGQAAAVIAAVHHAVDTLARVAAADTDAVATAIRAQRLYAPTRTLPDYTDVPYRYGRATPADTAALLEAYQAATDATALAATGLDAIAIDMNAPSQALAAARRATSLGRTPHADHEASRPTDAQPPVPSKVVSADKDPPPRAPGPVEQAVRDLIAGADPFLLLRARAIDTAGRELVARVRRAAQPPAASQPAKNWPLRQTAGAAAQRAAENFPATPARTVGGRAGASVAAYSRSSSRLPVPGPANGSRATQG